MKSVIKVVLVLLIVLAGLVKLVATYGLEGETEVCEFEYRGATYYVNFDDRSSNRWTSISMRETHRFVLRKGFFRLGQEITLVNKDKENATEEAIKDFKELIDSRPYRDAALEQRKIDRKRAKEDLINNLKCE